MIPKKETDYLFHAGGGYPFDKFERPGEPKTQAERQKPTVIHLADLNQDGRAPMNFSTKRGRVLPSFTRYWTPDEMRGEQEDGFDIE